MFWAVIVAVVIAAPAVLPVFRLNLLGRFLSLAIVALGIDLIWGFTGCSASVRASFLPWVVMGLRCICSSTARLANPMASLSSSACTALIRLPFFWEPFHNPLFTLIAIWLVPALLAALLGEHGVPQSHQGVYFSILTQAALLVFFNFFNGQQKLINGTNGLKTDVTQLFGQMVGSPEMQRYFFWVTCVLVFLAWLFVRWVVKGSLWRCADCHS